MRYRLTLKAVPTKITEEQFRDLAGRHPETGRWIVSVPSERAIYECASCADAIQVLERETNASR